MAMGKYDDSGVNFVIVGLIVCALIVALIVGFVALKLVLSSDTGPSVHQAMLKPAGGAAMTSEQFSSSMTILGNRLYDYGFGMPVTGIGAQDGSSYVVLNYVNQPYDEMIEVATMTGKVEIRIQATGSDSVHALYRDGIQTASTPSQDNGAWSVSLKLTEDSARKFRQACIDAGATTDPENHKVIVLLDDKAIYSSPIAPGLASEIARGPVDTLLVNTGTGDNGKKLAKKLYVSVKDGALPVKLEVAS